MNFKRPCFLMAVVFVLGEGIASGELGLMEKSLLAAAGILFLLAAWIWNKTSRGAVALLLVLLLAGGGRYRVEKLRLDAEAAAAENFGSMRVRLSGTVESCSVPEQKESELQAAWIQEGQQMQTTLVIGEAVLSSAYGSADALPQGISEEAAKQIRKRYGQRAARVIVYQEGEWELYPGQNICCEGELIQSEGVRNEGEFDFSLYFRSQGVAVQMRGEKLELTDEAKLPYASMLQQIRHRLWYLLEYLCEGKDAGLFQAILLGEKSGLDDALRQLFQDSGIAHIMAVSGLHLSLIGMGIYSLFRRMGLTGKQCGLLSSGFVISYGLLTGAAGSAMRAVLMLLLRFLAEAAGRSYDMLSAAGVAAVLLLFWRPYLLFTSGFQLSFMAVIALGIASELSGKLPPFFRTVSASFVLQLATLPIVLFHFFQFPPYGILLNFVVVPLMGTVVYSGLAALGCTLVGEAVGLKALVPARFALGSGHLILYFYEQLCLLIAGLPFAVLIPGRPGRLQMIIYYGIMVSVWLLMQRVRAEEIPEQWRKATGKFCMLLVTAALCLLLYQPRDELEITFLDVGQGDGIVIRYEDTVMTMDIGSTSNRTLGENVAVPYLKAQGISRINAAFISHSDADHTSGILYLLENCEEIAVDMLILPEPARGDVRYDELRKAAEQRGCGLRYLKSGDQIIYGEMELLCLYPEDGEPEEDPNRHSSGILLQYRQFDLLLTGDMDQHCEEILLEEAGKRGIEADLYSLDVLKAGHHGSDSSTSQKLLEDTKPRFAVLSYGAGNSYGHPHEEVLERLRVCGTELYETAVHGQIRLKTDGKYMKWECLSGE